MNQRKGAKQRTARAKVARRRTTPPQRRLPAPTLPDAMPQLWEDQIAVLPPVGPPGFQTWVEYTSLAQVMGAPAAAVALAPTAGLVPVNVLIWRDEAGHVRGILTHYPHGVPPIKAPNTVIARVDPSYQRRGIGVSLALEADRLGWEIDPWAQEYTQAGTALARRHLQERRKEGMR